MIKLRDQIPAEASRKFRLWHEKAMRTAAYTAAVRSGKAGSCNAMLAAKLRAEARKYNPNQN